MLINNYLGIDKIPIKAQHIMRLFLILMSLSTFVQILSNTFFFLFSIDNIGFALTGVTLSFTFAVQLITDYPTGSLGDWIGQRRVLALSYIFYAFGFYLMSQAHTFVDFMMIGLVNGLAAGQISGTMQTWLDNNYKKVIENTDNERKVYGYSSSRVNTMTRVVSALAFLVGGILATAYSRQFVFQIQAIMMVGLVILVYNLMKDEKIPLDSEFSENGEKQPSKGFASYFIGGLKFVTTNKPAFFLITGTAFLFSSFAVWGGLILIPLYFGYTGTDSLASMFRTIVFILGVPISLYTAKISRKFTHNHIPLLTFIFVLLFYPGFMILFSVIPIKNELNYIGLIASVIWLNILIPTIFDLGAILRQRILIDLVPSENRNAVYSLTPTIISVIGIFILPVAGFLIEDWGLVAGIGTAFVVAFIGAVLIFLGIYYYNSGINKQVQHKEVSVVVPT
ncbi:MAG: MFS transporter [Candidatus Hodarchaeales archaeon]